MSAQLITPQSKYEVDVVIKLVSGQDYTQKVSFVAPNEQAAKDILANIIVNIATRGILQWDEAHSQFKLYPAPGQIRTIHAKLPMLVTAN